MSLHIPKEQMTVDQLLNRIGQHEATAAMYEARGEGVGARLFREFAEEYLDELNRRSPASRLRPVTVPAARMRNLEYAPIELTKKQLRQRIERNESDAAVYDGWNPVMADKFHEIAALYRKELEQRPEDDEDE